MEEKSKIRNKKQAQFSQNWLTAKIYIHELTKSTVQIVQASSCTNHVTLPNLQYKLSRHQAAQTM